MKPSLANCTYNQLLRFKKDHVDESGYSLKVDLDGWESVTIDTGPKAITMSRRVFNHLIRSYLRPRKFVRRKP